MTYLNNFLLLIGTICFTITFFATPLNINHLVLYLYLATILCGGLMIFRNAFKSLLSKKIDENFLVLCTMAGFIFLEKWFEASALIILFAIGKVVRELILYKSTPEALEKLSTNLSKTVFKVEEGQLEEIPVEEIAIGDTFVVNAGQILAVDGIIKEGHALIRHASITKQSDVYKLHEGNYIFAGSFAMDNRLVIEATSTSSTSILNTIEALPNDNLVATKNSQEKYYSQTYAFLILSISLIVALGVWFFVSKQFSLSLYFGLVTLAILIAYPMLQALPLAVAVQTKRALKLGILFKNPHVLENSSKVNSVAFDKATTLTTGTLTATNIYAPYPFSQLEILKVTACLIKEAQSPLSQAFIPQAQDISLPYQVELEEDTETGFSGKVEKNTVVIGKNSYLEQKGIKTSVLLRKYAEYQALGSQALFIAINGRAAGLIGLRDDIRPEAFATIKKMQAIGMKNIIMLTDEHEAAAASIGRPLGLSSVSNLSSSGKKPIINKLRNQHGNILMIGDAIKDAVTLSNADMGVAICNMNAIKEATAVADIVLLSEDIAKLPNIFAVSKHYSIIKQNGIKLTLLCKVILLTLVLLGILNLWLALLVDIIFNAFIIYSSKRKFKQT